MLCSHCSAPPRSASLSVSPPASVSETAGRTGLGRGVRWCPSAAGPVGMWADRGPAPPPSGLPAPPPPGLLALVISDCAETVHFMFVICLAACTTRLDPPLTSDGQESVQSRGQPSSAHHLLRVCATLSPSSGRLGFTASRLTEAAESRAPEVGRLGAGGRRRDTRHSVQQPCTGGVHRLCSVRRRRGQR